MKKIASNRLTKVTQAPIMEKLSENRLQQEEKEKVKPKQAKKMEKKLLILEVDIPDVPIDIPLEENLVLEEKPLEEMVIVPKKKERKSKKVEKGIAILGPETRI